MRLPDSCVDASPRCLLHAESPTLSFVALLRLIDVFYPPPRLLAPAPRRDLSLPLSLASDPVPRRGFLLTRSTSLPCIANAPLPAEGSSAFYNTHYAAACIIVPWLVQRFLPFGSSWTVYFVLAVLLFLPVTVGYWVMTSKFGPRVNEKVRLSAAFGSL